jgi:hypothetical protein
VPEALAGMLNFNPLLMQQMAQNAATFALNSNPSQKPNPATIKSDPIVSSQQQELPTTSASVPQPPNPEWYNAMNYLNMASRQLQFMTAGAHPGTYYFFGLRLALISYQLDYNLRPSCVLLNQADRLFEMETADHFCGRQKNMTTVMLYVNIC